MVTKIPNHIDKAKFVYLSSTATLFFRGLFRSLQLYAEQQLPTINGETRNHTPAPSKARIAVIIDDVGLGAPTS